MSQTSSSGGGDKSNESTTSSESGNFSDFVPLPTAESSIAGVSLQDVIKTNTKGSDDSEEASSYHKNDNNSESLKRGHDPGPSISFLEEQLEISLEELVKNISNAIISIADAGEKDPNVRSGKSAENFACMYNSAQSAFHSLMEFGQAVEMCLSTSMMEKCNESAVLSNEKREKLRSTGRKIWMTVRSNPECFQDHVGTAQQVVDDTSREGAWKKRRQEKQSQNPEKGHLKDEHGIISNLEEQRYRAAASGYIRGIAARLILIDYICTQGHSFLQLISSQCNSQNPNSDSKGKNVSCSELEFGLKSFARSGRALLSHGSDAMAAFTTLSLAVSCWDMLVSKAGSDLADKISGNCDESSPSRVAKRNLEEAFDALALLPDAASLIGSFAGESAFLRTTDDEGTTKKAQLKKRKSINGEGDKEAANSSLDQPQFGTPEDVLVQVKRLEVFVANHCNDKGKKDPTENLSDDKTQGQKSSVAENSLLLLQRFLPSLARISYKHGNRFARVGNYTSAREALRIALGATNRCLAKIRQEVNDNDLQTNQPLQIQEQDMIVVSKESFYVLSHVCQAIGKKVEAHKCLDRIELYIDEQKKRDDELFSKTINYLGRTGSEADQNDASVALHSSSDLALEGPKKQDKADIKTRARAARAKAKHTEAKERANLAFSRIMIYHRSQPRPTAEEESAIDSQLQFLITISAKLCPSSNDSVTTKKSNTSSLRETGSGVIGNDDAVFNLALTATRIVRVRRLTEEAERPKVETHTSLDPFVALLETYRKDHQKRLSIVLDQLNAILTAIQILNEKKLKAGSNLNNMGITLGKNFLKELEHSLSPSHAVKRNPGSNSTLFVDSDCLRNESLEVIRQSRTQFARAVSLYRLFDSGDSHDLCAQWASLLSDFLRLTQKTNFNTEEQISKQESDRVVAEVMGVRAHALSLSGNHASGVKSAREAWELHQSVHNLVVLFYCVVVQEVGTKIDLVIAKNDSCDALLELDNCLNCLISASDAPTSVNDILSVFPILSNSCIENEVEGGGPLLLGVQSRWVELLVRSDLVNKELKKCKEKKDSNETSQPRSPVSPPGDVAVFCIVRAHLSNFENLMRRSLSKKNKSWIIRNSDSLFRMLDGVLRLLRKIRDRRNKRSGKQNEKENKQAMEGEDIDQEDYVLIWQHSATKSLVGDHKGCVWVAEQLWNIGVQVISADLSDGTKDDARWIASEVFSRAHDFALLAEEEEGASLSRGFLDSDLATNDVDNNLVVPDFSNEGHSCACDLSSEFSAHCLLLSVANAIDNVSLDTTPEGTKDIDSETKDKLKRCLHRLARAKDEFQLNQAESQHKQHIEGLIAWLALRCMVEIGDDNFCANALINGGLIDRLLVAKQEGGSPQDIDPTSSRADNPFSLGTDQEYSGGKTGTQQNGADALSLLQHIMLIAYRAESHQMTESAKHLLFFCSQNLLEHKISSLILFDEDEHSLGKVQQKLLQLSSSTRDALRVFEDVDKAANTICENSNNAVAQNKLYSSEEIDWFTVEAYNRGVNLLFLGNIATAEQLLAIALNLLPKCGKEVECHGAEMRNAYRGAVERKGGGGNIASSSAGEMISLFSATRENEESSSSFATGAISKHMHGF